MSKEITTTEYTANGLEKIEKASLLSEDVFQSLVAVRDGVLDSWKNTDIWRSETDMKFSVLNDAKFPTLGHKYLQSQKEQDVHFRNLMYLACEYEEKQGELMVLNAELDELLLQEPTAKIKGEIKIKEAQIKMAEWNLQEMQKAGFHRVREVTTWERIKQELMNAGDFDPNNKDEILKESYIRRWQMQLEEHEKSETPNGDRVAILKGSLKAAGAYGDTETSTEDTVE